MPWTNEEKLKFLTLLPWTIKSEPAEDAGEFVLRIEEMPGTVAVGTKEELNTAIFDAIRATLHTYLEFGDKLPRPAGFELAFPWEVTEPVAPSFLVTADHGPAKVEPLPESAASTRFQELVPVAA